MSTKNLPRSQAPAQLIIACSMEKHYSCNQKWRGPGNEATSSSLATLGQSNLWPHSADLALYVRNLATEGAFSSLAGDEAVSHAADCHGNHYSN